MERGTAGGRPGAGPGEPGRLPEEVLGLLQTASSCTCLSSELEWAPGWPVKRGGLPEAEARP